MRRNTTPIFEIIYVISNGIDGVVVIETKLKLYLYRKYIKATKKNRL